MLMVEFLSVPYQSNNTKFIIKLHVNGLEVMHSDIDSVTTGQVRIKGHLKCTVCVKMHWKQLLCVISIPNKTVQQQRK